VVSCFYSDHTGVLWLSTRYGGLHKAVFPGNSFSHQILKPNSSKPGENEVRAMFEDSSGRIWIAAKSGGLYVYRDGEPVKGIFTNLDQNALGSIYTIKEDRRGIIWIGTKGQGLFRAEPADAARSKFHLVRYVHNPADNSSISSNMIYSV